MTVEFLIIGGGPTGLGAAGRLQEKGREWLLIEAEDHFGGLGASFQDEKGFTWDLGGHVLFSHYDTFDRYMDNAIPSDGWISHERESWIWIRKRFVPYPFQNNLHRLPAKDRDLCLDGLKRVSERKEKAEPANFRQWIHATAGDGIAEVFLEPYNEKVWATPTDTMDWRWVSERVAVPNYQAILESVRKNRDDVSWGPNRTFRFPKYGGTGSIWTRLGKALPKDNVSLSCRATHIERSNHTVHTACGKRLKYRRLITTIPLHTLITSAPDVVDVSAASKLFYSNVYAVGVGLEGTPPERLKTKCWMYFPESNSPYYRVTVFSNYSPNNVPKPGEQWSLMAEVSESARKSVDRESLADDVVRALVEDNLIPDRDRIVSRTLRYIPIAYPTPFLGRDKLVDPILREFEARDIFSRGRFGSWKYEVANQDHCFAQGYECVERLLNRGGPEYEPTLFTPSVVNSRRNK